MNTAKHTPGPWFVSARRKNLVVLGDGMNRREFSVADCVFSSSTAANARTPSANESIANALLIAAAPDLLEALRDVVEWLKATPEGYETVPPDSRARAIAAIAKATGAAA